MFLNRPDNKFHNFCRPRPHPVQFSNLTPYGARRAREYLQQEGPNKNYILHSVSILFTRCCLAVWIRRPFQPRPLILGDPKLGKSRLMEAYLRCLIPGTWRWVTTQSDLNLMTRDISHRQDMVEMKEEVLPSEVGIAEGTTGHRNRNAGANTDKASRYKKCVMKKKFSVFAFVEIEVWQQVDMLATIV